MKGQGYDNTNCRLSAIAQVLFGFSCLVFGVGDRVEMMHYESGFPAKGAIGIWIGILIVATGMIGSIASLPVNAQRRYLVITYFISSIISMLLALIIADCYIVSLVFIAREGDCNYDLMGKPSPVTRYYGTVPADRQCEIRRKYAVVMIVIGLCELLSGILAIYNCIQIYRSRKQHALAQMDPILPDPETLETVDVRSDKNIHQPIAAEI
ncbi:uncharacterized protein LOC110237147 [Exaiptasia diaphana]|uniref:Uncharacterized protein n=1 Tax=Exaiptasia diaphana TaxID=2652724 RepID=A0A913X4F1_EXADI|nr:uncharacterized protein LOC110237147 [Exaiptasia diaphana]